jgi:hypothetical protein
MTMPTMPTQPGTTMPTTPGMTMHESEDQRNNGMYLQDSYINPYNIPMGVPMMPLYGYDNSEDADKDWDYMKQMYPITAKKIMSEIEDECDKLEYNGSCMFDEYPDRVYLSRIVDRIYDKTKYLEDDMMMNAKNISPSAYDDYDSEDKIIEINQFPFERHDDHDRDHHDRDHHDRDHHDHDGRRGGNIFRNLIEVLLFNEILNRRRRFRGRSRWF